MVNFLVDLNDPVIKGYLINLVGEEGYKVVANMPEGEVTDEKIAQATGVLLNIVRRTLFILYENRLAGYRLSLIHISEPTRLGMISYAVFCLKKKKNRHQRRV